MRTYAAFAILGLAATGSMASCHLFLESRGLKPGAGGGGEGGTASGIGGDPTTGGGGIGGMPPTGGGGVEEWACEEVTVYEKSFDGVGTGGSCNAVSGLTDDFEGDPVSGVWGTKFLDGSDEHIEHCSNSTGGSLVITPSSDSGYWWFEEEAAFVYQRICGSFGVAAQVTFQPQLANPPKGWEFNGVGLVAATTDEAAGDWTLLSFGYQGGGTLGAQTFLNLDGKQVGSNQTIGVETLNTSAKLGLCRDGDSPGTFHFFIEPQGEALAVVPYPPQTGDSTFDDIDGACCLDVGMTAHFFSNTIQDQGQPFGIIDWIEFAPAGTIVDSGSCADFVEAADGK